MRLAEIANAQAAEAERLEALRIQKAKEDEFLAAVWDGNITTVDKLLRENIKPEHVRDESGRSPFDLAIERGDQQMIQLLQTYKKKSSHERAPGQIVVRTCPNCRAMSDDSNIICTRRGIVFQD